MAGFDNDVMYAKNADFTQADNQSPAEANGLATNGQIWIGTTAVNAGGTHINVGALTSPNNSINFGYSSPNITAIANPSMTVQTLTGNSGVATPAAGNINVVTANTTVKFVGSGSTLTQDFGGSNLVLGTSSPLITTATFNTGMGNGVLPVLTSGVGNTCIGWGTGSSLNTSNNNTLIGAACGDQISTSAHNTAVGAGALGNLSTGTGDNVAVGFGALDGIATGVSNTCVGNTAGSAYTTNESGNIILGPVGGTLGESNVTRIGVFASQTACFIAGIAGVTVSNPVLTTINSSTGQLGFQTLTQFNVLTGGASNALNQVAPSATSGVPLISQGAASQPIFGTAVVAGGGTGRTTLTNHGVLVGAGTTAITQLATGSAGQILQSGGAAADPAYSTATYPSTAGTSGTLLQSNGTNIVNTTATYPGTSGTTGTILRSNGTNWVNTTATYPTTTTANRILYSSATNTISEITSAANSILSTDGSSVPTFGTSLTNDYTFTSSTAGGNRVLTVTNTDNTNAKSLAFLTVSTGGTSSGDPFTRYAIGTTRSYAVGIDNSDSQSLVTVTGASGTAAPSASTVIKRMTSGGNQTMPLNSCVCADLNTGLTNQTGDGTFVNPLIFDTDTGAFFDQNGNYDTTTGLFTGPVTGRYLVSANVTLNNIGAAHTAGIIRIDVNGTATLVNQFNPAASRDSANEMTMSITGILAVAGTLALKILVQVSGGTKTVGIKGNSSGSRTNFNCVLVS